MCIYFASPSVCVQLTSLNKIEPSGPNLFYINQEKDRYWKRLYLEKIREYFFIIYNIEQNGGLKPKS